MPSNRPHGATGNHFNRTDWNRLASIPRPRRRGPVEAHIIGSEVAIATNDVLIASVLAKPDAGSLTAAAHLCDFWFSTILRIELAWKHLQLDKGGGVRGVGLLAVSRNNQAAQSE